MQVPSFALVQINARSPSREQAPLIIATVSASACTGMLPKPK